MSSVDSRPIQTKHWMAPVRTVEDLDLRLPAGADRPLAVQGA